MSDRDSQRRPRTLEAVFAVAVVAGSMLATGVVPVVAQTTAPETTPAPLPAPEDPVEWGPVVEDRDPRPRPPAAQPEPLREAPRPPAEPRPAPREDAPARRRPRQDRRPAPAPDRAAPGAAPECELDSSLEATPLPGDDGRDPGRRGPRTAPPTDDCEPEPRRRRARGRDREREREDPRGRARPPAQPDRNTDGSPTRSNPGMVEALPGAVSPFVTGVPNFVISKFRVPVFLLPIYQAAGIEYGVRWEVLAAINEIETDYGRNLNVSSAGALGWMQFIPSSWEAYGVDANKDGRKDPYNPVDAIFAAGRYLKAAGYEDDVRGAIFAYNHADWYVDSVMLRARLISGVPADLVGSLTGLTEGRFPIAAKARYADDVAERTSIKKVRTGENAANVVESDDARRSIEIYARPGAPVVATNDARVTRIERGRRGRRSITIQDVYGNTSIYRRLGSVARTYPVPRDDDSGTPRALALPAHDPQPRREASAGRQPAPKSSESSSPRTASRRGPATAAKPRTPSEPATAVKRRLFANPEMPGAREAGGLEQLAASGRDADLAVYRGSMAPPLDPARMKLRPLRKGAQVIGGTVLGRVGATVEGKASHLEFAIRPAGKGAPTIDPKPILDGWKLLEATAIYRASGRNVLHGEDGSGFSVGQVLLLPKPLLERRVLSDERIELYEGGRADIRSGQIDRRVLATLAYLSESGMRPTVTSLRSGRTTLFTASGNLSAHPSGNAVDIAAINGTPILGNQSAGGVTEQAVRRLMLLQGTVAPDQIISLLDLGANTLALSDHADHIHVGFQPRFGDNPKLGQQAMAVLKPGQWSDLLDQLGSIENPVVPTSPSKYSLPADKPASDAHNGE